MLLNTKTRLSLSFTPFKVCLDNINTARKTFIIWYRYFMRIWQLMDGCLASIKHQSNNKTNRWGILTIPVSHPLVKYR